MTISTADALDVLTTVAACHRRTAPKLDDRDAAMATATIWAKLFNAHNLTLNELQDAVMMRAQFDPVAPEPAEIITFARKIRKERRDGPGAPTGDRDADRQTQAEFEAARAAHEALCESKAEDADELAELRKGREDPLQLTQRNVGQLLAGFGPVINAEVVDR